MRRLSYSNALCAYLAMALFMSSACWAIPWDRDDFFVTGGGTSGSNRDISVFDSDLTFKGYLADSLPAYVGGFDFDAFGNLVATIQAKEVRVYSPNGQQVGGFSHEELGSTGEVKVGPNGNYYIATPYNLFLENPTDPNFTVSGLIEFTPTGNLVRRFATDWTSGIAIPNDKEVWAGHFYNHGVVDIFDSSSGKLIRSIVLDDSDFKIVSMQHDAVTDTILIASQSGKVIELRADGAFVQSFEAVPTRGWITRGPNGDVFAGDRTDENRIFQWSPDGILLKSEKISNVYRGIGPIAWAGNGVPEPSTSLLVVTLFLIGLTRRQLV